MITFWTFVDAFEVLACVVMVAMAYLILWEN